MESTFRSLNKQAWVSNDPSISMSETNLPASPSRSPESAISKKPSKQRKIIIAISSTIIVLMIIAASVLVAVFLVGRGERSQPSSNVHYRGSFRIVNLNYTENYKQSNNPEYQSLVSNIEKTIETVFNYSELQRQFKKSQVFRLSPGSVIPEFVITFNFNNAESKKIQVLKIFSENIKNASGSLFNISVSSLEITEITSDAAQHLVYSECGVGGTHYNKVVGGTNAALGSWPWQASLRYYGNHKCGASLISNKWLVTAAHCMYKDKDVKPWTVVLGTIHLSQGSASSIKSISVHENYSSVLNQNDIALIQLTAPVTFTQYIRPVCLPSTSTVVRDNSPCYVTGWGTLSEGGNLSPVLQQAELRTISTSQCSAPNVYWAQIKPSMLCAGYLEGKIDSCQGDSGGPLVAQQPNSTWYLIGIVSFGNGCAVPNKPGVYARVTYLRQWITKETEL